MRKELLRAARKLFSEFGYAETGTNDIVAEAKASRGALYHHFKDKSELLEGVIEEIAAEAAEGVTKAAEGAGSPMEGLILGCFAFLRAATRPDVARLFLIEGPTVLGWTRWREIDRRHAFGLLVEGLAEILPPERDPEPLAVGLSGAMNELAMWTVERGRDDETLQRGEEAIRKLLAAVLGDD